MCDKRCVSCFFFFLFSCHWDVMEKIQMCNLKCLCLKPLISPVLQRLGSSFATCRWCPVYCIRNYCWAIGRVCLLMRMWNCVICIITVKELSTKQPSSYSCMIALFLQHLQIKLAPVRSQHSSRIKKTNLKVDVGNNYNNTNTTNNDDDNNSNNSI